MTFTARRVHYTYERYLTLEDGSAVRHPSLDGEIYAMANVIQTIDVVLPPG